MSWSLLAKLIPRLLLTVVLVACSPSIEGTRGHQSPDATLSRMGSCKLGLAETVSDEEAIVAVLKIEGAYVVQQDIASLVTLWADDGRIIDTEHTPADSSDDQTWHGKDAIRHRYVHRVFPGAPNVAQPLDLVVSITGEKAVVTGTTRIGDEVSPAGDRWLLVKMGDCWLIQELVFNLEPSSSTQESLQTASLEEARLYLPLIYGSNELAGDALLDEVERRAVAYFWQEADPDTGLIKDRAGNFQSDSYTVSSTAAVGFGLAALAIAEHHGWLSYDQAYQRTLATLRFLHDEMRHEHGFYYHFVDLHTGQRVWNSEVSSVDTAWLLAGVLLAGEYFSSTEIEVLADELYRRVDFEWMLTDGGDRPGELLLNHGWTPEGGFLPYRWDTYSELMLLYLLAIGSPTHPIPPESWDAWARPQGTYAGYTTFAQGPLFTHQFSHAWVDFRDRRDRLGHDYFQSSVNATLANRQFCIDNSDQYQTYDQHVWGLTASDGPDGYQAYGAPPGNAIHDGTAAPAAPAGSVVFTPELSLAALQTMQVRYGDRIWGRYGFSDAFNVDQDWWGQDVIGINLGITLLMIENYRSGLVWQVFERNESIQQALELTGLTNP